MMNGAKIYERNIVNNNNNNNVLSIFTPYHIWKFAAVKSSGRGRDLQVAGTRSRVGFSSGFIVSNEVNRILLAITGPLHL